MKKPSLPLLRKGSFKKQIISVFVLGFLLLISAFVAYMTRGEALSLYQESDDAALGMARSLSVSSRSWVLASDLVGLQEVIESFDSYPELDYAMIVDPKGKVLAHTDLAKVGLYLSDRSSLQLLKSSATYQTIINTKSIIDIAVPIQVNQHPIGWARLALGRDKIIADIWEVAIKNVLFILLAGSLAFLSAIVIAHRFGARIDSLDRVAEGVRRGNFSARVDVGEHRDEITGLAESFNRMLDTLNENEQELRIASRYSRRLLEANQDPLMVVGADRRITDLNQASETVTGKNRQQLLGSEFSNYFTDPKQAGQLIQQALHSDSITDFPLTLRHKSGRLIELVYNASIFRDDAGAVIGVFVSGHDITERKQAETLRTQLAAIVESSSEAIIGKTPEGIITHWNKSAERIYGYSAAEMIGQHITTLVPPSRRDEVEMFLSKVREGETVVNYESERLCKDGSQVEVELSLSPINDADGKLVGISTIARDITDKKRAEQALRESEQKFRALTEASPMAIYVSTDIEQKGEYANPTFTKMFGYTLEEVPSAADWWPLAYPDETYRKQVSDEWQQKVEKAIQDQSEIEPMEVVVTCKDGSEKFIQWGFISTKELNCAFALDLTERKQAEEQLRRSEYSLTQAQHIAHLGSWELDLANDELTWSDEIYQIFEIDPKKFGASYEAFLEAIHPDDRDRVNKAYQDSLANKESYEITHRLLMKDGRVKYVNERCETHFDAEGRPLRSVGTVHDITDRYEAEQEVMQLSLHNKLILDSAGEGIYGVDTEGLCTFVNPAATKMLGYTTEEMLGEDSHSMFHHTSPNGHSYPKEQCPVQSVYRQGKVHRGTTLYWRKDGSSFPADFISTPIMEAGVPTGAVVIFNDITERRQQEEELRQYRDHLEDQVQQRTTQLVLARDAAEAANKAKSVFLANMSHELRTPLNAILGFSNMMRKDPELPEKQHQDLDIINRSGEHLLTLINDVLDMAKIEAGRVQLDEGAFDLGSMVRDVTDMMQIRAQDKGLHLLIDQSSKFPRYIVGDEARLRQILINLLGNAVKFTEQGGVTIRLGTLQNEVAHLIIEVEDSGPGISAEDQKSIFEPFVQVGEQGINKGTGLGLSITRQFVQLMGGHLSLRSTPGKGSIFRVEIPLREAAEGAIADAANSYEGEVISLAPGQQAYRILIVEDQHDNQLLLSKLLDTVGFQFKVAENGLQGIEMFQDWQPHLILMDRRMPIMDGLAATKKIRELPGGSSVKIVAVTASAFQEQRKELLDAGMDDFIRKPFRSNEIYECLRKHLGVEYVYAGIKEAEAEEQTGTISPEMLAALPGALRTELKSALESLEQERISHCLATIGDHDSKLQNTLTQLAENFDYPSILKALQDIHEAG